MLRPLIFLFALASCSSKPAPDIPVSACSDRIFEESQFTVCAEPRGKVEIRTADRTGKPYRGFAALQTALGGRSDRIAFAMNAGMFGEDGNAIGLLVEDGKELHRINLRDGRGNFHLKPNGVFKVLENGTAEIVTSDAYEASERPRFATQSGPMLVVDGKLHPKFDADGQSRYIRNGVGIGPDGTAVFVISRDPVSFGKFARFFRDSVHAKNALYFDGSVSSLWDPANGRMDAHSEIGPMVVVFKAAESKPGPASPARP